MTDAVESPVRRMLPSRRTLVAVGVALLVAIGGALYIASPSRKVSTDNAYLKADSSIIAPKIRGHIAEILVHHNESVVRGQPLVRIDPEEFQSRVEAASADLKDAEAAEESSAAALVALTAEEKLAASNIRAAQTAVRAADAEKERADADNTRYSSLVGTGAVSRFDADQFRAVSIVAQADADRSRAQFDVSRDQAAVTHARRSMLRANVSQAAAAVARAKAALALAQQDLQHTTIVAPVSGVVGDRQVEQGDYVQAGTRLLTIVPLDALYVVANFKETQTARMLPGQAVQVEVDALPGIEFNGRVDSFAPGAGSQFSLLPFEPGTGNFTKIVQRIPVRIRFDANQPQLAALRPGLSTTVTVQLQTADGVVNQNSSDERVSSTAAGRNGL